MFTTALGTPCEAEPASEVTLYEVPEWLRQRMLKKLGLSEYSANDTGYDLWHSWVLEKLHGRYFWLDHWGSAIVDGKQVLVSEPYRSTEEDFSDVRDFAESLDCDLVISEKSHWYPGKTIRLAFVPKTD